MFYRISLLLFLGPWFLPSLHAQVSVDAIMDNTLATIQMLELGEDQILHIQVDHLKRGDYSYHHYFLSADHCYVLTAEGDGDRITDVDMELFDVDGDLVASDADGTNFAYLTICPAESGQYAIRVEAYALRDGLNDGFYSLVLARE